MARFRIAVSVGDCGVLVPMLGGSRVVISAVMSRLIIALSNPELTTQLITEVVLRDLI